MLNLIPPLVGLLITITTLKFKMEWMPALPWALLVFGMLWLVFISIYNSKTETFLRQPRFLGAICVYTFLYGSYVIFIISAIWLSYIYNEDGEIEFVTLNVTAGLRAIGRGDLVYLKGGGAGTVIALPGDSLEIGARSLAVNGRPIRRDLLAGAAFEEDCWGKHTVSTEKAVATMPLLDATARLNCVNLRIPRDREVLQGAYIIYPFAQFGKTGTPLGAVPRFDDEN